jgi:hypothetical protein
MIPMNNHIGFSLWLIYGHNLPCRLPTLQFRNPLTPNKAAM